MHKYFLSLLCLCLWSGESFAQLAISSPVDMDFGNIEFAAGGGQNDVFLATNGNVTYTGNFSGNGLGTSGELLITDTVGTTVEIACNKSLDISNGSNTLAVDRIEYAIGVANGVATGLAQACNRTNKFDGVHVITGNSAQDTLVIGGRIRTSIANVTAGVWNSTNTGGTMVDFVVLVQ